MWKILILLILHWKKRIPFWYICFHTQRHFWNFKINLFLKLASYFATCLVGWFHFCGSLKNLWIILCWHCFFHCCRFKEISVRVFLTHLYTYRARIRKMAEALKDVKLMKWSGDSKDGKPVNAAEHLKDKVVALYFSAHWCPPCRQFTPVLKVCLLTNNKICFFR